MALTTIIAPRTVPAGTFGPTPGRSIAAKAQDRTLLLQILSDDWTTNEDGLQLDLLLETSEDGGTSWQPQVSATMLGGAVSARTGALPSVTVNLPAGIAVLIRGTATLNQRATSLGLAYDVF